MIGLGGSGNWDARWTKAYLNRPVGVGLDSAGNLFVADESNNATPGHTLSVACDTITPTPPSPYFDFVVEDVSLSGSLTTGSPITLKARVKDQGTYSGTRQFVLNNVRLNLGPASCEVPVGSFTPQVAKEVSCSVTLSTAGTYVLSGAVDIYNVVAESNEQNNQRLGASYTIAQAPSADLIALDLSLSPLNAVVSSSISFTGTIKNQGAANAGGFWSVFCVDSESMDQCYGNQDGQVGEAQRISSLAAGATSAPLSSAGSWSGSAGVHTAYLCADILGEVSEGSNESHTSNCVSKAFTVYSVPAGQPDLAVIDLAWSPADPSPGASASFTITIANYGTTATEAMRIGCHLGSPSGTLIGETWLIAFMPGETRAIACGSRNFSAGTYEIFGVVETEAPEAVTGDDVGSEKLRVD